MNNNHCRFLFVLFKARIIGIASSSASCKKGGIYSYKVEVTFAIDRDVNWDYGLCFSSETTYKFINAVSDCRTGSIENQIIDIGYTSRKEQLDHLNHK